jgi:pilus assembly protein TadC
MGLLQSFGKAFIPQRLRPRIRGYVQLAGMAEIPYGLFGAMFAFAIVITFILYVLYAYPYIRGLTAGYTATTRSLVFFVLTFASFAVVGIVISYLAMSAIYVWLDMRIFKRTQEMESVLVDFLQFVSENLKAGMSFDRALFFAIKPQFTVLSSEVRIAAKRAMTGEDVEEALTELARKYDSNVLSRSFSLIVEGLRGGGEIAGIIDRVVENLRETKKLKEEMAATTLGYVIFITFVVTVIAPGLFALAKQLLLILGKFLGQIALALNQAQNVPLKISTTGITPEDFTTFSYLALIVVSLFSSMIISIIQRGDVKSGLKYVPVFIIVSMVLFFVFQQAIGTVMSAFFTGV